eukprot:CAMPEP_0114976284 /NCGR_PEP_ID=MMETSP0216-20121206/2581_1 /TAXON_ID=223996 /ORGANISM="Protocruzia adherens, Strain Boccale" /LENGTH=195 /DNA_ID=CAMNT_0002337183 /DNA_START=563 /DNA_END=1150 /DNA_ORIENTATION=-
MKKEDRVSFLEGLLDLCSSVKKDIKSQMVHNLKHSLPKSVLSGGKADSMDTCDLISRVSTVCSESEEISHIDSHPGSPKSTSALDMSVEECDKTSAASDGDVANGVRNLTLERKEEEMKPIVGSVFKISPCEDNSDLINEYARYKRLPKIFQQCLLPVPDAIKDTLNSATLLKDEKAGYCVINPFYLRKPPGCKF